MSASQLLNAPIYYTTLAPNDVLPDPNFYNQCKPWKLTALTLLLKTFTQFVDARKSRFTPNIPATGFLKIEAGRLSASSVDLNW